MQDDSGQKTVLQDTVEEKDLGIWMDSSLKFSVHVAHATAKTNQILGLIRRSLVHLDITLMKQLYISMVHPHLESGNVVWHPMLKKDQDDLESVQRRATKRVYSVEIPD